MTYEIQMPHWPTAYWAELPGTPLERISRLLEAIDNPQEKLSPVIQVAGTNGKGSIIAFLRAMLDAAGYSVNSYTSPHMQYFNERISLHGKPVEESPLHTALEICRMANEELPISFFEGTTAAAYHLFKQNPADITLIETGIGGREDPTNVFEENRLAIISTISQDHVEHLGMNIADIAAHKAGIIKPECPVIIGFQPPEALEVLEKEAESKNAPTLVYGKHWAVQKSPEGFIYADGHGQVALPAPALKGPHQLINAGCAIAALSVLDEFDILGDHIAAGLKWVQWPGRIEEMNPPALNGRLECWFDGGHNMAAGHMLAVMAEEEWQDGKPLYIIFGTTRGKDVAAMLAPLTELSEEIIAVPVAAEPKCYTPQEILDQGDDAGISLMQMDSVAAALEMIGDMTEEDARILVFGSLYLRMELL
jgi:dihydrofolate synthase/folylpolyglutamate synthase